MNKKLMRLAVMGLVFFGMFTAFTSFVTAQGGEDIEIGQYQYQGQQDANGDFTYRFRARTRVRINASVNVFLNVTVDADEIGDETFSLDIDADGDVALNMWCARDQDRLGLQNGSTVRNQHRHQIRNNFVAQIQTNRSVQARIGMEMTKGDADRFSWAYYDEPTNEWIEVESHYEDGMLVTYTDHFSIWALSEDLDATGLSLFSFPGLWIVIGVAVVAVGSIAAVLINKKRA